MGRRSFVPAHRDLAGDEAVAALASYEQRNRIAAPLVRRALSRLAGWAYDGSDESRRRMVAERPLVLFCPATGEAPAQGK